MNGRMIIEDTPEGRLAAVAYSLMTQMQDKRKRLPDYVDFKTALLPFVLKEQIDARLAEERLVDAQPEIACGWTRRRITDLSRERDAVSKKLPKEFNV
jgi:hypothetical protein